MKHKIISANSKANLMREAEEQIGYTGVSVAYAYDEWTMLMVEDEKKSKGLLG